MEENDVIFEADASDEYDEEEVKEIVTARRPY